MRLGRPHVLSQEVIGDIQELREGGSTLRSIADQLNQKAVPTAHGGARWHAATVRQVLRSSVVPTEVMASSPV